MSKKNTKVGGAKAPSDIEEEVNVLAGEEIDEVEEAVDDKEEEVAEAESPSIVEALKKEVKELKDLVNHSLQMGKFNIDERKSAKAVEESAKSDIELTRAALALEPKKTIVIPKGKFDPVGAIETVTINGLRFEIKKGTPVEVPESIYLTLCEYLDIDNRPEVTEKLLDRNEEVIKNLS